MVKRIKYWQTGLVIFTALAFSIGASAPSSATSLAKVAQWYTTVYGSTGQLIPIGATPASASTTQPSSTVPANNTVPATTSPSASSIWSGYSAGYSLNAGEQQLLGLVNEQRAANKLSAYTVNLKLSYLARLRAQEMANDQTLTHFSPTYGTPPQMEEAAGISGNPMGAENICEGPSVSVDNTALFNSPPHRANLLDPQETQIGLGVAQSSNGIVWVSELFLGN